MNPTSDDELTQRAQRRVNQKMGFYKHLMVYVVVNLGLAAISLFNGHRWFLGPMLGWGLGLAIHGLVTFTNPRGDGMRERMLAAEVDKLKRQQRP
jgi:hypothetical protein